jgi:hypothetical protein
MDVPVRISFVKLFYRVVMDGAPRVVRDVLDWGGINEVQKV